MPSRRNVIEATLGVAAVCMGRESPATAAEHSGPMVLKKSGAALLVVDMQNGFLDNQGSMARAGRNVSALQTAVKGCGHLVSVARSAKIPIIFTRYVFAPDYSDGGILLRLNPGLERNRSLRMGDRDSEIIEELAPLPGEIVIDKNIPSAFYQSPLEKVLERSGIKQLVVCGVTTNCCVETTVRDAAQRNIETFVVTDATAEWDDERHRVALKSMGMFFATLTNVGEIGGLLS